VRKALSGGDAPSAIRHVGPCRRHDVWLRTAVAGLRWVQEARPETPAAFELGGSIPA
jgi:hypothetical protein